MLTKAQPRSLLGDRSPALTEHYQPGQVLLEISSLKCCCGIYVSTVIHITSIMHTDMTTMISKLGCFSHGPFGPNPLSHMPHSLINTTAPHGVSARVQPDRSVILSNSLCPQSSSPAALQTCRWGVRDATATSGARHKSVVLCR